MRLILVVTACAAIALTACQPPAAENKAVDSGGAEANAVANETGAGNEVGAQIAALAPGLRNATLFRAILDSKERCNGVEGSVQIADKDGHPRWRADCKDNGPSYAIEVPPDGMLVVVGPLPHGQPAR